MKRSLKKSVVSSVVRGVLGAGAGALRAVRGWTGTENCLVIDGNTITVEFNKPVTFTELTIPNGITISHDTGGSFEILTVVGSGTDFVTYSGNWDVQLIAGDLVLWDYDGGGDYADDKGELMTVGYSALINCRDAGAVFLNGVAGQSI